jgi:hypothetical protein
MDMEAAIVLVRVIYHTTVTRLLEYIYFSVQIWIEQYRIMSVKAIITIDYLENTKSKKNIHAFNRNVLDKGDDVDL